MAVKYTNNFNFPLLTDGGKSWGAVINGVFFDLDEMLGDANILVYDILTYENEILVYEGDVLKINSD
ncbi:hypothetical protein LCGC14_1993510 [marine sediment metagenome]|uniref:Uncharacterized protein n=1 Tax=marine sediment metagenome TaxID=412755 RepID=A0A0F9F5K1_9ZZZZ